MEESPEKKRPFAGCMKWGCGCGIVLLLTGILFGIVLLLFAGYVRNTGTSYLSSSSDIAEEVMIGYDRGSKAKIAVLPVEGVIQYGGSHRDSADPLVFAQMLECAKNDPDVQGVLIRLDTPGGEVNAADDIYHQILAFRKETKKPVVAWMNTIATSGGYYVAAACDKIVAGKMTLTGSIGVIISNWDITGFLHLLRIENETYKSGEFKDMLNPARKRTKQEREMVQNLVEECYQEFARIVSDSRKIPLKDITSGPIGDGRIFHGAQAVRYKLVDVLGRLQEAAALVEKLSGNATGSLTFVEYSRSSGLLENILGVSSPLKHDRLKVEVSVPGTSEFKLKPGCMYYLPGPF